MTLSVVRLKPEPERDQEKIAGLIQELQDAHKRGEVKELLFGYIEPSGTSCYVVSGNMRCSSLAYLISVFNWKLMRWLDAP